MTNHRFALTANTDWYLANFRFDLADSVRQAGNEVHCIAPAGEYLDRLGEQGFKVHALELGSDSFSLLDNRRTLSHLKALYRQIQPDLVHHFTPRCVVLGSMAARNAGVTYVVNALTGLGHVFTASSFKAHVARPLMRHLLKKNLNGAGRTVIFQNQEDMAELVDAGIVDHGLCHLIRGSGVDTVKFQPRDVPRSGEGVRVLFASRLIGEKGVFELVKAMRHVVAEYPAAELWIAGEPYAQNPTSLTDADIQQLEKLPFVRMLGHRDDVADILGQVDIVALPTYREGTPKILLEAAACGLPIVATDIPGCRGVVETDKSGFLVPVKDVVQLANAIQRLCADPQLRQRMGEKGREIILNGFSSEIVVTKTLEVYKQLLSSQPA